MILALISNLLSAYFAFCLPAYSTFKALSHRPISDTDLERLSMYWTVMGLFVAFQYSAEWLISWFPFYFEIKTIFLLFLSLPSIQGSTFIYRSVVQPFFSANEAELDTTIASFQNSVVAFLQTRISGIFDIVWKLLNKGGPSQGPPGQSNGQPPAAGAFSLDAALGAWKAYGPAVLGGLSSARPASASSTSLQPNAAPQPERRTSGSSVNSGISPASTPGPRGPPPPFPEPQHFQY